MPNQQPSILQRLNIKIKCATNISTANLYKSHRHMRLSEKIDKLDTEKLANIGVEKDMLSFFSSGMFFPLDFHNEKRDLKKSFPIKQKNYTEIKEIYNTVIKALDPQNENKMSAKLIRVRELSTKFKTFKSGANALIADLNEIKIIRDDKEKDIQQKTKDIEEIMIGLQGKMNVFETSFKEFRSYVEKHGIQIISNKGEISDQFYKIKSAAIDAAYDTENLDELISNLLEPSETTKKRLNPSSSTSMCNKNVFFQALERNGQSSSAKQVDKKAGVVASSTAPSI